MISAIIADDLDEPPERAELLRPRRGMHRDILPTPVRFRGAGADVIRA